MPRIIPGEGQYPNNIFICGERPGFEEARSGHPFVGPAGAELWDRLWMTCKLSRDDVYVTNLVKVFSKEPPSAEEVKYWTPYLQAELMKVKPKLIITVGYHAARWFLPQFEDVNGDYFHGLAWGYTYGRLVPRVAVVVPVVHSSAALRQPALYQNQFTNDLRAVRVALGQLQSGHTPSTHRTKRVVPYQVGLAGFGRPDQIVGFDSEFSPQNGVEAVTLSVAGREAACIEIQNNAPTKFLKPSLTDSKILVSHMAKAEYKTCHQLGIDTNNLRIDDTMLMAYLLGLPRSLKVLSFRELGYQMKEYEDLVQPLDNILVRKVLRGLYDEGLRQKEESQRHKAGKGRDAKRRDAGKADRGRVSPARSVDGGAQAVREDGRRAGGKGSREGSDHGREFSTITVPPRACTSLKKILETDTQDPPRARWQKSTFSNLIVLPPPPSWRDVPEQERRPYAMTDAIAHREVRNLLWPRIISNGLRQIYEIDRAVLPWLVRNEEIGLACDVQELNRLSAKFKEEFADICRDINVLAGFKVNPLSGEQVSDCLFEELGITPTRPTKSGKHFTTQDKYLKARKHEHKIVPKIIEARQINKLVGTYAERLPSLLVEGRYHPDWNYTGPPTGRLAEEIIVLIPKHTDRGRMIRNCFHAAAGNRLVSVDLSQIELRAMAHLSGDEELLKAYRRGEDLHAKVAHELLGAPKGKENQDESKHRLPIKTFHFSLINGTTEFGLLEQLHENGLLQWDIEQARELIRDWFKLHHGVDEYWQGQQAFCRKHGYVKDLFGRKRYIYAIHSTNDQVRREAERQCLCPIQATADGISKVWNKRIWRDILLPRYQRGKFYCEPWVRVHDDTTLEVDKRIAEKVKGEMLALVPDLLKIPTTAEGKIGRRWANLH